MREQNTFDSSGFTDSEQQRLNLLRWKINRGVFADDDGREIAEIIPQEMLCKPNVFDDVVTVFTKLGTILDTKDTKHKSFPKWDYWQKRSDNSPIVRSAVIHRQDATHGFRIEKVSLTRTDNQKNTSTTMTLGITYDSSHQVSQMILIGQNMQGVQLLSMDVALSQMQDAAVQAKTMLEEITALVNG